MRFFFTAPTSLFSDEYEWNYIEMPEDKRHIAFTPVCIQVREIQVITQPNVFGYF
jgi:16S rRNA G1207 methylase RsmC